VSEIVSKTERTIEQIRTWLGEAMRPVVMLSFGKDSMVMAALIRAAKDGARFPIDVIYHRDPWFPHKHKFAEDVARSWGMRLHDFPPVAAGVKVKPGRLELVARYNCAGDGIDIPKNVCHPDEYPRREYICGLQDWLLRPKVGDMFYPWDMVFIGHKSSDVDQFEGPVPLRVAETRCGQARVVFPLRDWTDEDVWDYIERERLPVQRTRYNSRAELADKWHNNDYTHACTACIDPRVKVETVWCPKLRRQVPNRGSEVLRLEGRPRYIGRVAA
jgi:hypothetical protein